MKWSISFSPITTIASLIPMLFLGYGVTKKTIKYLSPRLAKKGLSGRDLNKATSELIPEDGGLGPAALFFLVECIHVSVRQDFAHITSVLGIIASAMLGFIDDVVDLRWRHKLVFPCITLLPAVMGYAGDNLVIFGFTFSSLLTRLYCLFFTIFSQNAVNIYAGINGIEVGQVLVATGALLIALSIRGYKYRTVEDLFNEEPQLGDAILLLILFLTVSIALYSLNRFPSKVFVGDVYAYFGGATFALAAMLGGELLLAPFLFGMQILNFGLSLPQLLGWVPCPRHRLPRLNTQTGKLEGLPTNLNLINQYLRLRGPVSEKRLFYELVGIQICLSIIVLCLWAYLEHLLRRK
ncbi:UDP-N-acetylglucosamine-dolichyl-phosphate N-acetylglucosaminephosphotransferase [Giardia muris]|uniref:UDP-N-acetylglucosamine--dolichyl-phosphate N-acetylglucosaminephosphotransferase n=1 Tax=Giardia muris TaxID=5742 RepID=A0A4Z1SV22_GIAMU|nr:UDP-N-acetylglucosamine-dolichyl-phosphate N-acetylglucosaminephosphotransferase [Giardia muris]|eukprot:TNJ29654.1 UDP-N-acetylglucosamine-dolichyl-phosphate N-acetylglucosaminephosphotransferase [Giardia muris]